MDVIDTLIHLFGTGISTIFIERIYFEIMKYLLRLCELLLGRSL